MHLVQRMSRFQNFICFDAPLIVGYINFKPFIHMHIQRTHPTPTKKKTTKIPHLTATTTIPHQRKGEKKQKLKIRRTKEKQKLDLHPCVCVCNLASPNCGLSAS